MRKTKESHIFIFGNIFIILLFFITFKLAEGVKLRHDSSIIHTNIVYYDGAFSDTNKVEDTKTALYVLNQSKEYVYATIFEYDKNHKEVSLTVQIGPNKSQFIKTDGPGVVYLMNTDATATSVVKFSNRYTQKKYTIPEGFTF